MTGGRFEFVCRESDYATLGDAEIRALYEERRGRLEGLGALVPAAGDVLLDPAPFWLQVAFLDNVIRYEEGSGRP
jgi:hypothetical protein